jgi:hypothetical protein
MTEDAIQAAEFKMVPSKADTKQVALPAAFKDADVPAKAAVEKVVAEDVAEPTKRPSKVKADAAPAPTKNVTDVLASWATDDDA